ncbi:pyridoxamine 5'-phosphate oxidase family protein [Acidimicrobiia bacterium EGI L10123]|uniref:pyridoxamine 5'-phosphate oxidase family protein n=1 Tax=Salinilacustrithrix flava TaxID=2957203 RepID=UPI003D7C2F94|nr:pyridoxamine 5'-phosphate oxidase family protein [Acidimicrobiia bacterium EGI L10123]
MTKMSVVAAHLTPDVVAALDAAVLGWLATADEQGVPNVSPKEVFAHLEGDRVVIAHIASPRSARNARANPQGCFSVVDVFRQRGCKLTGALHLHGPEDERFEEVAAPLRAMVGDLRGPAGVVVAATPQLPVRIRVHRWDASTPRAPARRRPARRRVR